jgi:acetoacetyl-CoA synthetase
MPRTLWTPTAETIERSAMGRYRSWLQRERGVATGSDYTDLWRWSTADLEPFWRSIWDFCALRGDGSTAVVATSRQMPGVRWFPDLAVNYAENALIAGSPSGDPSARARPAVLGRSQTRSDHDLTWSDLWDLVERARSGLQRLGVGLGDRVAAYLPNIPETVVAFLATASLGAIWSSCAPEFGTRAVLDRLGQIGPKVLLAVDGYRYGGRTIDRRDEVATIRAALGNPATVVVPYAFASAEVPAVTGAARSGDGEGAVVGWDDLVAGGDAAPLSFVPVAFDHPLYVLYSSGTTGLPKAIVHGHGGILLEHAKAMGLHLDLGPDDRLLWFTTTGWMMWNFLVSALLRGAAIVCVDGDPAHPDLGTLWRTGSETGATYFGVSAPFLMACRRSGIVPARIADLSAMRSVGSTGAPLPPEGFEWVYEAVAPGVQLGSLSGGTDVCAALVGSSPMSPVWSGEISCRCLGVAAAAFGEAGTPVATGVEGELVVTEPMPSMPVGFWGDGDGRRYRAAYFERFPGVWAHGDWVTFTDRGSCVIGGRSDATLNRGGVRLGTAEFYAVVESLPGVEDSLIVHLEDRGGGPGELVLFVVPTPPGAVDDDLRRTVAAELRRALSPRHVPDRIHEVPTIPKTLSGKKLEIPVKRVLLGARPADVASLGSLADPASLDLFAAFASADGGGGDPGGDPGPAAPTASGLAD